MRTRMIPLAILGLTLVLAACAVLNPPQKQRKAALDDFMYALRWQRYAEAANYFNREHRQAFLDQFEKVAKDLTVTEVRLLRVDLQDEGRRAETQLEMDYYLLPSATLKTMRISQIWLFFEASDSDINGFLITTPFPEIPGQASRSNGTLTP